MPGHSPAGATQVIEVALTTTTLEAARPPTVTVAAATVVKVDVEAGNKAATAVNWLPTRVCSAWSLGLMPPAVPRLVLFTVLVEQSVRLALAGPAVSGASGKAVGLSATPPVGWVEGAREWLYPAPSWGALV